jgi:hypothetical protein
MDAKEAVMKIRAIVALAVLLLASVPAPATSAALLQPLMVGWERYFKLDWTTEMHGGHPVVYGRIYNNWGFAAANVRLLVEGVTDRGDVVSQRVSWLGMQLTPGTTAPFEVAVEGGAPAYRVSVFAFDWVQRGRGLR